MSTSSGEILIQWLAPEPDESVLDAGCGMGFLSARLAATGASITGVDQLPHLLEQARLVARGCDFIAADLFDYKPANQFDAIFAHATLTWIHPPKRIAKALHGMLKPGGRLAAFLGGACAVAADLEAYYKPKGADYEKLLRKAGFRVERWEEAEGGLFVLARKAN